MPTDEVSVSQFCTRMVGYFALPFVDKALVCVPMMELDRLSSVVLGVDILLLASLTPTYPAVRELPLSQTIIHCRTKN